VRVLEVLVLVVFLFGQAFAGEGPKVVVGIDSSGSMKRVVNEARKVYGWIQKEVPGGAAVYAFNDGVRRLDPGEVKNLRAGGGTCLSCFFRAIRGGDYRVAIVITDGMVAPEDLEAVKRTVAELKKRNGFRVCAAAVGGSPQGIKNLKAFSDVVFTDAGVRSAVRKCLGRAEIRKVLLEETGVKDPDAAAKLFF